MLPREGRGLGQILTIADKFSQKPTINALLKRGIWGVQKPPNLFDIICDQPLVRKMMCNYNQDDDRTSLNSVWFKPWTATHHLKTLSLKVKLWIRIWLLIILGFWLAVKVETLTLQRYRAWLSRSWSFSNRIIVLCCSVYETISMFPLLPP